MKIITLRFGFPLRRNKQHNGRRQGSLWMAYIAILHYCVISYLLSYGLHKLAVLEKTEKFIFGDKCIRCGKCVDICPMNAISMQSEKPVRKEKECAFCLACVNVCPTRALQVGKKTQGNPQYINPYYNGKAREQK